MQPLDLQAALFFHNPWWQTRQVPADLVPAYQRPVLTRLLQYLTLDRVLVIKGPRRTGKSTLLFQMIAALLQQGVPPDALCYASFDDLELRQSFDDLIRAFEQITHHLITERRPVYFFLDEMHYLPDWEFQIKKYFDKKLRLKFILSGSAATILRHRTESLAGRTLEELVLPFSFAEVARFKLSDPRAAAVVADLAARDLWALPDTTDWIPYRRPLEILFAEYVAKGGFPHIMAVAEPMLWKKLLREDIVEKVLYRDLVEWFGVKKPGVLERLFLYLTGTSSEILNISNLSGALGLSREYTEKYVDYLRAAYLVGTAPKYARSVKDQVRSMAKVYCLDSGLLSAFGNTEEGKMIESLIYRHLYPLAPYYWRERHEVDFVLRAAKAVLPIESKYSARMEKKDLAGLLEFMARFKARRSLVITKDRLARSAAEPGELLFIPAWLFLLWVGSAPEVERFFL